MMKRRRGTLFINTKKLARRVEESAGLAGKDDFGICQLGRTYEDERLIMHSWLISSVKRTQDLLSNFALNFTVDPESEIFQSTQSQYLPGPKDHRHDLKTLVLKDQRYFGTVKIIVEKVKTRKSSTNSKKEEILSEPQQENEASSTDTSEDNPKIIAFRGELEEMLKAVGQYLTSNMIKSSVNSGSEPVNTFSTQTDCIQDTAQRMKLKRLKVSIATRTRQTDAEQRRPTIKKLEVKQVEFKLGEDCWDIQE
ncbi:hypothetical protein Tco_0656352 [Tanacetum coccineum]|uniref:Uncharacterized protein n=1 Tax=Tanacetum coccineum TaxID=301880 RepID=A0ABQ4X972_9ASTR